VSTTALFSRGKKQKISGEACVHIFYRLSTPPTSLGLRFFAATEARTLSDAATAGALRSLSSKKIGCP
jgi:hypothetical protein